mmetsp:Transcript_5218/g.18609  ORF Transcript_5218/g.18609 Transcript_5218/m.18609 type:complete len:215 (-) Transcript_5218:594-1238(-)
MLCPSSFKSQRWAGPESMRVPIIRLSRVSNDAVTRTLPAHSEALAQSSPEASPPKASCHVPEVDACERSAQTASVSIGSVPCHHRPCVLANEESPQQRGGDGDDEVEEDGSLRQREDAVGDHRVHCSCRRELWPPFGCSVGLGSDCWPQDMTDAGSESSCKVELQKALRAQERQAFCSEEPKGYHVGYKVPEVRMREDGSKQCVQLEVLKYSRC